jgi:hypothetical protein
MANGSEIPKIGDINNKLQVNFKEEFERWLIIFIYKLTSVKLWAWAFSSVFVVIGISFSVFYILPATNDKENVWKFIFKLLELWAWVTGVFISAHFGQTVVEKLIKKKDDKITNGNGNI